MSLIEIADSKINSLKFCAKQTCCPFRRHLFYHSHPLLEPTHRTLNEASERVSSWPEWKRSTILYRDAGSSELSCSDCRRPGFARLAVTLAELNRELDIPESEVPEEIERMAPGVVKEMAVEAVRVAQKEIKYDECIKEEI